ncbi:phosphotransferase [Coralloluteibacterium stylophorae]|uniref:Phosphotransferase n=1 Tax=Coralloluteibacterium stylophorae TaxID=1776034 RepID=A0A8J7VUH7_9GAMM|nr:phosphotransferase [Coralloluteibacterium stylophorae]MBS7458752.1 phosphotransferase [Coralloluteibacterium stylophorae]
MIERETLLGLVPHQGAMCLLDRVAHWDAQRIRCTSRAPARDDDPLRAADSRLRAVHLCEYGAQATAVHGGLLAHEGGGPPRPGMLVALRGVELHVGWVDPAAGELVVDAERLVAGDGGWQYAFEVRQGHDLLASGRVAVMLAAGHDDGGDR